MLEEPLKILSVVATRDGGTPQQIRDGVSGIFVPHENPPALARELLRLIDQPELRGRLGAALRQKVVAEYSIEAVLPQWQALLDQVARKQTANSGQLSRKTFAALADR